MKRVIALLLVFCFTGKALYARTDWLNQLIKEREKPQTEKHALRPSSSFFKHHQLVLFYASACPYCHQFAPILKLFSLQQGAQVLALSFDNQPLKEFNSFKPATTGWVNAAFQGKAIRYPALFILNPQSKVLYPVSIGGMSQEELQTRMKALISKVQAYERGRT